MSFKPGKIVDMYMVLLFEFLVCREEIFASHLPLVHDHRGDFAWCQEWNAFRFSMNDFGRGVQGHSV